MRKSVKSGRCKDHETYGNGDFGCGIAVGDNEVAVGSCVVDLFELHTAAGRIRDGERSNGVCQFGYQKHKAGCCLADHTIRLVEHNMAGPRARKDSQRLLSSQFASLGVERKDADEICSQVGNHQEFASGIQNSFMLVRGLLSLGIKTGLAEVEDNVLLEGKAAGTVDVQVPAAQCTANVVCQCDVTLLGRITINDAAHRPIDGFLAVDFGEAAVVADGEGCERAVGDFETFVETVKGGVVGVQSEPRWVWGTTGVGGSFGQGVVAAVLGQGQSGDIARVVRDEEIGGSSQRCRGTELQ